MNKQQLASKIWASANKMRSKIEANDYKDYILGFIFYKFLSDKEETFLKNDGWTEEDLKELTEEDAETVAYCQRQLGYFISYENLFSTWLSNGRDFKVDNVRVAISAFNRFISGSYKKVFENIFNTLDTGLSKLGDTDSSRTKSINDLIQLIKDIPTDGSQDYDVLGFIYEYLISNFAANAGKKAGEFYTPHEVAILMSEIVAHHLKDNDKIEIYDPTSGSGSLLINIGRSVAKHINDKNNIKYYAQELKENTYNLTRMNLVMRNILPDNIHTRNADTLEDDWPYFDDTDPEKTYNPLYVDAVVSNPPYSQSWDSSNKEYDPRYERFGLAPKGKADYAFLLHDLYHVKPSGIMTIVLPHGVLFRGGEEGKIRENLIEQNHIDAIIGLPANIFFGTGIPTIIIVLRQKRENTDVLFVDASKGFIKDGKNNKLRACDIKKITDAVIYRTEENKFSRKVERQEIRDNEYNLNIPRYVDSSDDAESWDIYASMFGGIPNSEIDGLAKYWAAFPTLRGQIFKSENKPYSLLAVEDIKQTITDNVDVRNFIKQYNCAFSDFSSYLYSELIENMLTIKVAQEENVISGDIFCRLRNIALIDRYQAYQVLDDQWSNTATDLEVIQTEGFEATRRVEPNMVIKKKDGKEVEVQEGWIGRVIPFELVQQTLLSKELGELKQKESDLEKVVAQYPDIIDEMSEEEKEGDYLNDDNSAFVPKQVKAYCKELAKHKNAKFADDTLEGKLLRVDKLIEREKKLKKEVKDRAAALHQLTKETIESLSDEDILMLLDLKWIQPLCDSLAVLPVGIINDLVAHTNALAEKYATTLVDLEREIRESERSLSSLIDDLDGNEYDMAGLREFQKLLAADDNEYKLKTIKKACLEKMLPHHGSTTPELRFKGFTEEWEEIELGNVCVVKTGCPFDSSEFVKDGKFRVITNGNIQDNSAIVDDSIGNKINIQNKSILDEYLLNIDDILVTMDGTVGRTAKVVYCDQVLAQRVGRLIPYNSSEFVYQSLNTGSFYRQMTNIAVGGTIKHISLSDISNYITTIPKDIVEQDNIGLFFKKLDELISKTEQKIEKLKNIKKGCLDKMFV